MRRNLSMLALKDAETCHAFGHQDEHVAMADVINGVVFTRCVWRFLCPGISSPSISALEDAKVAIQLASDPVGPKHVDVRHHFLIELVLRGEFDIVHVESGQQLVYFVTQPLGTSPQPQSADELEMIVPINGGFCTLFIFLQGGWIFW